MMMSTTRPTAKKSRGESVMRSAKSCSHCPAMTQDRTRPTRTAGNGNLLAATVHFVGGVADETHQGDDQCGDAGGEGAYTEAIGATILINDKVGIGHHLHIAVGQQLFQLLAGPVEVVSREVAKLRKDISGVVVIVEEYARAQLSVERGADADILIHAAYRREGMQAVGVLGDTDVLPDDAALAVGGGVEALDKRLADHHLAEVAVDRSAMLKYSVSSPGR